jgi:GPH family glycoside/pentoside/hexuronide:cation symporter
VIAPALGVSGKFKYGLGNFAWAAKDTSFHYFLFFYYTQLLGLSASLAGLAALLALVADGISDPIIGQLSDNWKRGKWGRRHPFMIVAVVPFCLSLIAIFNPPADLSQQQLFAWYLAWAITVRTFLTLFTVPHMALGAELTDDYTERTAISVYRNILGYVGGLSIQTITWFVLIPMATAAGALATGYRNVGFLAAAIALVGMVVAIVGTRDRIPYLVETSSEQQNRPWYYAFSDVLALLKHQSARTILLGNLVIVTGMGLGNTMLLHVNNFIYGFTSEQMGIFMLGIFLALLPASWLALQGTRVLGKPKAVVVFLIMFSIIGPIPVLSHVYGFAPATGTMALLGFVMCFAILHQTFYISFINVLMAMLPDVADELETKNGLRQEGILNSALMLTQKVTFGFGAFIAGLTIDFAGLDGIDNIVDVTHDMTLRLGWVYGPGMGLLGFIGALVFSRYRIDAARYREIRDELAAVKS